jgi:predicted  nucleic acid-binding Zn-ribbon protein
MALSMSISAGKHNARHNTDLAYRAKLPNVDPKLSRLNFTIKDEPIEKAYNRIFGKSLSDYNAKQRAKGHSERCIADYHAKVEGAWKADSAKVDSHEKGRSNVPKPCYEYVLQLGNRDTFREELDYETAKEIFKESVDSIEEKTKGAIDWFQVTAHFDEPDGTWHIHMAGIPYGEGNKRGLEKQVSMTQALKTLNLKRLPDLQNLMMGELEKAAAAHGIERRLMDCDRKHLDVQKYQQLMRDYNDLTDKIEQKRSRVAELARDIESKERTVARLDCSIETKTKRLNSLTEWLQEAEKKLDEILPNLAEIAGKFKNWLPLEKPIDILRRLADNPLIARREVLAAVERDKEGKAIRAANKSIGEAMKSASDEISSLADEARAMRNSRNELEGHTDERGKAAAVKNNHGRD